MPEHVISVGGGGGGVRGSSARSALQPPQSERKQVNGVQTKRSRGRSETFFLNTGASQTHNK